MLHARFNDHSYPPHTHDSWTVLMIDRGEVAYGLDRVEHRAAPGNLTILPPHVPHDGRSTVPGQPYRKRVLYLDAQWLPESLAGAAVSAPTVSGRAAVSIAHGIHRALAAPSDRMAVEHGLIELHDLVRAHLGRPAPAPPRDAPIARRLRALLDDRLTETVTLAEAARVLGAHPKYLARAFTQAYGIPPHRYVTGRRIDLARRLLLAGHAAAEVATATGFHDQPHLTRHFRSVLGTTPATFARTSRL